MTEMYMVIILRQRKLIMLYQKIAIHEINVLWDDVLFCLLLVT